ncbi:MAG: hypothetical protein JEZ07_11115 [Phycisphaerae bacterium]|nr:hypothetical protein [Phycisphaerae bacterium]
MNLLAMIFTTPMDIPITAGSLFWALPICLVIAMVYKAVKLDDFDDTKRVIREISLLFVTLIAFLSIAAVALNLIIKYVAN